MFERITHYLHRIGTSAILFGVSASSAYAAASPPGPATSFDVPNPLQSDSLLELINSVINVLIILAAPITVIMVVYAGFLYVTSAGNEEKVKTANKTIAYAAIGFAILLISKSVVVIVEDVLGGSSPPPEEGDGEEEDAGTFVASILLSNLNPTAGEEVRVVAALSLSQETQDAGPFTYTMRFGNGREVSRTIEGDQLTAMNTWESPGTYTITLSIVSSEGHLATRTTTIVVEPAISP